VNVVIDKYKEFHWRSCKT